jgi:hypothetical protein
MRASLRLFCLRLFCWCALLVLPAGAATAATRSFTFTAADQGAVTGLSVVTAFTTTVRNTGTVTDTYTVTTVKEMPAAWSCSLCEGTICYPPFIQQISFNLAPGSETNVDIDLTPLAVEGAGVAHVTVASQGDPSLVSSREFRVVTTGVEVLLVDGDGGQSLEDYYAPALASGDVTWASWPRHEAGALASPELEAFAGVIWFGEAMEPALDEADRSALAYYVQHGGTLLLCGQDLAWQACSPASPWYSSQAAAWFQVVLGTAYAADATGAVEVAALPAAPFGSSWFSGTLNGSGGAGNSTSPDALTAVGAGALAQTYRNGNWAAVTSTWGAGRSLFCGYAVESLGASEASLFLHGFLDWALGRASGVDDVVPAAPGGTLAVAPNPFNPSTTLRFDLAASGTVQAEICDLGGRVVRRLARGVMAAGPVVLAWDGRDDAGFPLPSGVYVARVTGAGPARTAKLVLAK